MTDRRANESSSRYSRLEVIAKVAGRPAAEVAGPECRRSRAAVSAFMLSVPSTPSGNRSRPIGSVARQTELRSAVVKKAGIRPGPIRLLRCRRCILHALLHKARLRSTGQLLLRRLGRASRRRRLCRVLVALLDKARLGRPRELLLGSLCFAGWVGRERGGAGEQGDRHDNEETLHDTSFHVWSEHRPPWSQCQSRNAAVQLAYGTRVGTESGHGNQLRWEGSSACRDRRRILDGAEFGAGLADAQHRRPRSRDHGLRPRDSSVHGEALSFRQLSVVTLN